MDEPRITDKVHQVPTTNLGEDIKWRGYKDRSFSHSATEELEIRQIAVALHNWHCHDPECTWNYEDWHITEVDSQKMKYYEKAQKFHRFFGSFVDVNRVIHFIRTVNPRLSMQLVEEL